MPEIEAIATDTLAELEAEGYNVVPTAKATQLTMNREGIRRLAAETLSLPTSPYAFADNEADFFAAVERIGMPCVVKPIMSSSGKGQSVIKTANDIESAWQYAQEGGRAGKGKVIVEGFVDFDYEITLLTIRHKMAPRSARRSATIRKTAIIASPGNRTRCRTPPSPKPKTLPLKSPMP